MNMQGTEEDLKAPDFAQMGFALDRALDVQTLALVRELWFQVECAIRNARLSLRGWITEGADFSETEPATMEAARAILDGRLRDLAALHRQLLELNAWTQAWSALLQRIQPRAEPSPQAAAKLN